MPFDVVIGSCNPVALPLTVEFDPPRAIGRAVFTPTYEGAPGCVHGAVLAGAFDIMLTAANVIADGAGPTVSLSIRYLKPTLIGQPARVRGVGDRARPTAGPTAAGRLIQGGHGHRRGGRGVRQHGPVADQRHAPAGRVADRPVTPTVPTGSAMKRATSRTRPHGSLESGATGPVHRGADRRSDGR